MRVINIVRLTWLELWQSRTYRIMLLIALIAPIGAIVIASLFLSDVGKVYVDGIAGASQLLAMVFMLFMAVSLLGSDVYQKICYLLLNPPVKRSDYFIGRYFGLCLAFLVMLAVLLFSSSVAGILFLRDKAEIYQSGFSWMMLAQMMFFYFFQYISILGVIFFLVSWASGNAEIMLFAVAALLFSWLFPPILKALQDPLVQENVPQAVTAMLQGIYEVLPHLEGAQISLLLSHGSVISFIDTMFYMLEHIAYSLVFFMLGLLLFNRRDL